MSSEDARKIVQNGLDQLKIERKEREAALEAQEQQLRRTINVNHTARTMTAAQHQAAAEEAARKRRQERAIERREEAVRTMKADRAVRLYGLACLVILLLAAVTELPLWGAAALAFGLMVFPAVYIFRLYVPLEE